MAAERRQQQQQHEGAVAAAEPSVARRLWRVVRAVLYMLRRGLPSGRKLGMDLQLLLHRGKVAGGRFLASAQHGRHAAAFSSHAGAGAGAGGSVSCGALDPRVAVDEPSRRRREVEFSCSNTPSSASGVGGLGLLGAARRRRRRRRLQQQQRDEPEPAAGGSGYLIQYYSYDAAEVARVFEMLSDEDEDEDVVDVDDRGRLFGGDAVRVPVPGASSATPSPAQAQLLRLVAAAGTGSRQQARVAVAAGSSASPADGAAQVDRRADEFIRRFYEQLRAQRSAASTPDCYGYGVGGASPYAARAPRPVTAGIA
jgi:hypothetical protein